MHSKLSRAELKEIIENPDAFLPRKERPSELAANPIAIHQPTAEWPTMSEAAYHGPAGDVVRAIEPHTESDKVAILIQYLAAAGNIIGRAPHYRIEGTRHHPNLFIALVGETSKARKGTSWDRVSSIFALVDDVWLNERVKSGLSTGEGLINEVRDAINMRARLTRTEAANGYANRYLYPLVKRSKELPFGGDALDDGRLRELAEHSRTAIEVASKIGSVGWTTEAAEVWRRVYGSLSAGRPGLLGAVTSRAEAQCVRLALIYTVLDGQTNIGLPHVNAALAVWEYCEASSAYIFGASLGDPVADEILRALRQAGAEGMSRNSIRDLFGRHQSSDRIGAALAQLMTSGKARAEVRQTAGRPVELWFAK
jgi:hypothetical protein